ncbi:MAG: hypothetical protein DMF46_02915 [Verrucomicrobia bacterium]|nr:MAG: hypothetical protein DMF46_02915 [Verrucomicrobiota bacterium]
MSNVNKGISRGLKIKLSLPYVIAFLALTILCGTSHEFVHHFVGAASCGCFGYKTFNSFELCSSCAGNRLAFIAATWAGPLFTYGLMWLGVYRLSKPSTAARQLGFALIFANFPINRIGFALIGWNDEQYVTNKIFGHSPLGFWLTNLAIWILAIPPLLFAYRAITNRHRVLWFIGFFVLPFVFVFVFAGMFLEQWLLLDRKFLAMPIIGIPYLILLVEVLSIIVLAIFRHGITTAGSRGNLLSA